MKLQIIGGQTLKVCLIRNIKRSAKRYIPKECTVYQNSREKYRVQKKA